MRTVDPELWFKRLTKPSRMKERLQINSYQASNFEIRLRKSFSKAMKELASNLSLSGVRPAMHTKKPMRSIFVSLLMLGFFSGVLITLVNIYKFRHEPPLLVNQQLVQHPLQHVEFPAVALCSYNIISKRALHNYARRLASLDNNGTFTLSQIEANLLAFGGLLTKTLEPFDLPFMKFLSDVDQETNVTNIMLKLSPTCESRLKRCSWKAKPIPCRLLFATRITGSGICCVMNARYSPEDKKRKAKKVNFVGQDQSLLVVVKEDIKDVAFVRRPCHDVEVTLFDGIQYPLTEVSGVHSYPAHYNSSVYMKLHFEAQHISHQLMYHSEAWRGCRVSKDGWTRNEAACILQCRRNATLALCSCVPYTLQPEPHHIVCSPVHLRCLNKHKDKLTYFKPTGHSANHVSLDRERSNGVLCAQCQPDCMRREYFTESSHVHYNVVPLQKLFINKLLNGINLMNSTVIRIFYASEANQIVYLLETNLRFFEDIALMGSHWILLSGGSIFVTFQVIYYCTIRWRHHHRRS
ncbi:unnamed protein product [Pieris brassicae]|uniref:Uncharacterized protein n=1 Tax=Pieris brassicae TaxID=7116 RepID=A0A9P0TFQ9_PIEBR|nr:unnamed protein product [Pieris brassicae]